MSYPTYDSYKDSGVEWLGEVPSGWDVERLKINATVLSSNVDKKTIEGELPVRLCNYTDVYYHDKITAEIDFMEASAKSEEIIKFTLCNGDVVITKDSETPDDIGVPTLISEDIENLICGYHLAILRGGIDEIFGPYLFYAINSELSSSQFAVMANGVTRFGLSYDAIKNVLVVKPPMPEQKSIAAFLDEKTSAIDDLIAKKEKLLELLAEKRTALITQAVTKGLDPNAPMKPSEIDWVGDIPQDWKKKKMSWFFRAEKGKNSQMFTKEYCGLNAGEFPVYSGQTGNDGIMGNIDTFEYDFGMEGCLFSTTVGAKAMTVDHLFGKFNLSQNCMIMTPTANVALRYYYYYFTSLFGHERGLVSEHMQASFRVDDFYHYQILLPSHAEQERIAQFLDDELVEFKKVQKKIFRIIAKLKEYRIALITNAVTGKIKVI